MTEEYQKEKLKEETTIPPEFRRYTKVFSEEEARKFPPDRNPNAVIELLPGAPEQLNCKVYPLTKEETRTLKEFLAEELEKGFITETASLYTSPVFFINKKDSKEKRLIIDYRRLNEVTKRDNGPLPRMDTLLQQLEGKELFSKFDIRWGYNNIPIEEGDRWKAAFKTPLGTYQSNVLTFGLKNALAQFTRLTFRDFKPWLDKWHNHKGTLVGMSMDDLIVPSEKTPEGIRSHYECIHELLAIMEKLHYHLRPAKCQWLQESIEFLGVILEKGKMCIDPAKREGISKWPRILKDKTDVQRTMGMLQYHRRFIPHFSHIAQPIFATLKKGKAFVWTKEAKKALDPLIKAVEADPHMTHPNPEKPFEIEIDASNYATGAVLIQRDELGRRVEVGYHSEGLNPAERNYDVYDREFLALIRALRFWRYLLEGSGHRIKIYTDHANLTKHREAQKLSGKLSRYISFLARFDFELHHLPGKTNTTADALSRWSDYVPPEGEEPMGVPLPDHLFIKALIRPAAVEETVRGQQKLAGNGRKLTEWAKKYDLHQRAGYYWNGSALVVPNPENMSKALLEIYHDGPTTGHPGQAKTYLDLRRNYWWPGMHEFVKNYVRGCAVCQEKKIITRHNQPQLYPIPPEEDAKPFQTIAMDLIIKLPESRGYDTILTITDHNCTKGVILVPCKETMGAEELAKEYKDRVFPFVGIPSKIISDRDTRFTSHFAKEVCAQLEIKQNISTAYHPQTDGQSEKTNQHVETALRIFCNHQQNDWADYLLIVQYMLNARVSETTKKTPFELWMGYIPRAHQPERASALQRVEWNETRFKEVRNQAQEAMKTAQHLGEKKGTFTPYQKDDRVWLDAKNLKTMHPTTKLRPLRYGLFKVTEVISPVAYRL